MTCFLFSRINILFLNCVGLVVTRNRKESCFCDAGSWAVREVAREGVAHDTVHAGFEVELHGAQVERLAEDVDVA